jgi:hypothetical protein
VANVNYDMKPWRKTDFMEDLKTAFGERALEFSPDLVESLQTLWNAGIGRELIRGTERELMEYERGRSHGHNELSLLFTKVVSGRKVDDVMRVSHLEKYEGQLSTVLQPWVVEAFQKILDAPDLEAAARTLEPAPERSFGERFGERLFSDPALANIVRPSIILEEKP